MLYVNNEDLMKWETRIQDLETFVNENDTTLGILEELQLEVQSLRQDVTYLEQNIIDGVE